jgi:hypothetical protein
VGWLSSSWLTAGLLVYTGWLIRSGRAEYRLLVTQRNGMLDLIWLTLLTAIAQVVVLGLAYLISFGVFHAFASVELHNVGGVLGVGVLLSAVIGLSSGLLFAPAAAVLNQCGPGRAMGDSWAVSTLRNRIVGGISAVGLLALCAVGSVVTCGLGALPAAVLLQAVVVTLWLLHTQPEEISAEWPMVKQYGLLA